jgi:putative MATE family efflux protein
MLLGAIWARDVVDLLQLEGRAAEAATRYIRFILPVLPLVMVEAVGVACLRGAGDMVTGLVVMTIVNALNVAVSWSLVLGLGPMPELGWDGLAIGTTTGYVAGGLLVVGLLIRGRRRLKIRLRWLRPDKDLIRRLLWIGLPGGADMISLIACQFWFVAVINGLGDLAAAAHGVAIRIESLAFLPGVAFQVAATTLVGQYLGARDYYKASHSVWMALAVGGSLMTGAGVLFLFSAPQLAGLFVGPDQSEVARQAAPLLRIVSVAVPALALTMILSGALRGAGDTRWPLVFTMVGFLVVRIPAAYWLAFDHVAIPGTSVVLRGWGLGVAGAWYAMAVDLAVRAVLVVFRFRHGGWKRIEV